MVTYRVDLRSKATGDTEQVLFSSEDHEKAWDVADQYNASNPNSEYFADVYNDEG